MMRVMRRLLALAAISAIVGGGGALLAQTDVPNPLAGGGVSFGPPWVCKILPSGLAGCVSSPIGMPMQVQGHLDFATAAPPTYASGGGGSVTFPGANPTDASFTITTSATTSTTVTINFGAAWGVAPTCIAQQQGVVTAGVVSSTTTPFQVILTWATTQPSVTFSVLCLGRKPAA